MHMYTHNELSGLYRRHKSISKVSSPWGQNVYIARKYRVIENRFADQLMLHRSCPAIAHTYNFNHLSGGHIYNIYMWSTDLIAQ